MSSSSTRHLRNERSELGPPLHDPANHEARSHHYEDKQNIVQMQSLALMISKVGDQGLHDSNACTREQ